MLAICRGYNFTIHDLHHAEPEASPHLARSRSTRRRSTPPSRPHASRRGLSTCRPPRSRRATKTTPPVAAIGRPELDANAGRARAIVSLCDTLTVEAAAPLVLDPLLNPRGRLAQLEGEMGGASTQSRRALTEVVAVLKSIVGRVAPETVQRYYVDLPPSPLPSLLSCLTPSPDAIVSSDDPFAVAAEARRCLDSSDPSQELHRRMLKGRRG